MFATVDVLVFDLLQREMVYSVCVQSKINRLGVLEEVWGLGVVGADGAVRVV